MGSCNSINVAAAAAAQKLAAMNPENQRKAERERQKQQEEDEQHERQRVYCQEKADEQMNEYTEKMNEEPLVFSTPKDAEHTKNVDGYNQTKVYEEFYAWRGKLNRLERYVPLPAKDGADPETPEWENFARYHSEAPNSAEMAERLRSKWQPEVAALREQFVAYCEAWLRYAMFDQSGLREAMSESMHDLAPSVWTQDKLAALKAEMAPLVEAADVEKAKRKDGQYDVFVAARNQAWAAILDQVANKTQELLPAYKAWLQEQSTVDAASINRGNWESFQGKMVNLKSSNEEYYEDINYTADKWDVESFYEKVGNTFIQVDWAENITSSWQKLNKKLEQISEKIYNEYFPNNDCKYVVSHTPTFSPAENVGALQPEQKQICRTVYREFDSEEMRLYRGNFHSDRERLDYMRRMDTGGKHIGDTMYKLKTQYQSAPAMAATAVYRQPQKRDAVPLHFLVFPQGNCLDGLQGLELDA